MLRCKFRVDRVEKIDEPGAAGVARRLSMSACVDQTGDNEDWSKYTPAGDFSIYVTNPAAFPKIDSMKPGDAHYLDLSYLAV